jgi:glutamate racemase
MSASRPKIGVFDSGVGGLTVLRELRRQVPHVDYLYFGDTARLPYGSKSSETVAKYAISAARFLEQRGAEYLVIACNTASALALDAICAASNVPVLGVIGPGAEQAAKSTKKKIAVVIATEGTVNSHAYRDALAKHDIVAEEKACPLFVPLVEEGWVDHPVTEEVANIYLSAIFHANGKHDVLVLGCTHYPLLKPLLRRVVPAGVTIVDSAEATAALVASIFPARASSANDGESSLQTFATDSAEKFRRAGEKFLGTAIGAVEHAVLPE